MAVGFHDRRQQDAMAQPMRGGMQNITPGTGTPFLWGGGGRRVAHGDLDLERQLAAQQLATGASFAPVAHWSQGLARVANALAGRVGMDRADDKAAQRLEAEQALKAEQQASNLAVIQALMPGKPELAAALANPGTADVAQALLPKPDDPPEVIHLSRIANDPSRPVYEREAAAAKLKTVTDPWITFSGPTFGYAGPQSGIGAAMGGGGPSGAPQTTAPPAEAVEELRRDPSGAAEFDEVFGAGAAARVLGGGVSNGTGGFPDPMKAPGTMTSGRRTVAGNRAVGGVARSHHLTGDAVDYVGTTVEALRQYFGAGARFLDEGDHIHTTLPGYGRVPYFGKRGTVGHR